MWVTYLNVRTVVCIAIICYNDMHFITGMNDAYQ